VTLGAGRQEVSEVLDIGAAVPAFEYTLLQKIFSHFLYMAVPKYNHFI